MVIGLLKRMLLLKHINKEIGKSLYFAQKKILTHFLCLFKLKQQVVFSMTYVSQLFRFHQPGFKIDYLNTRWK